MQRTLWSFAVLFAALLHFAADAADPELKTMSDNNEPTARSIALGKVVNLVEDLRVKVEEEAAAEAKAFSKFEQWCRDESTSTDGSIASAENDKQDQQTIAEAAVSASMVLKTKLEHEIEAVATHENDMREGAELRQKERKEFDAADASLSSAIVECDRAIEILSRTPEADAVSQVSAALTQIIARTAATPNNLQSFFQSTLRGQQQLQQVNLLQNAAVPKSDGVVVYEGHSKQVQSAIRDFQQFTEEQRTSIRKEESQKQVSYDLFHQAQTQELKTLNEKVEQKKAEINEQKQIEAAAGQAQSDATERSESLQTHLADVKAECEEKHRENKERTESRSKEMLVLEQARKLIKQSGEGQTEPYASFLQVSLASSSFSGGIGRRKPILSNRAAARAVSLLQVRAQQSTKAKADPFGKVRRMVENMLTKLMNEGSADAEHHKWCTQETYQAKDQRKTHAHQHAKFSSKVTMLEGEAADTAAKISEVSRALADMNKAAAEAAEVRKTEKVNADVSVRDYSAAQRALRAATDYLNKFYEERSLENKKIMLQMNAKKQLPAENKPVDPSAGKEERQKDRESSAQAVLDILEIMVSDFVKLQLEVETEEATALRNYNEYVKSYAAQKAASEKEIEHLETNSKRLAVDINEMTQERDSAKQEVAALDDYIEKLVKSCTVGESFEERQERRKQQIEGLQNALTAISQNNGEASVSVL